MHTITLTRANISNADNNLLVYDIPGSKNLEGSEIALSTLYMYYSWENINAAPLGNNIFYLSWPSVTDGTNTQPNTLLKITIPDGIYEVSDLNSYMQQFFISNNLYLINSTTGEYVYFAQMQVNPTRYAIQFNSFSLPTSLPTGYTAPPGGFCVTPLLPSITGNAFPTVDGNAPGWSFPANFAEYAGFAANYSNPPGSVTIPITAQIFTGLAPFPTGNTSFLSTKAPQVTPNPVVYLNCNAIQNTFSNPQTFLYPIPAKAGIGQLLQIEVPEYSWNSLTPGQFGQFRFTFTDNTGQPIKILDPNIIITCVIRDHDEKSMNMGASNVGGISRSMETLRHGHKPAHNGSDSQHTNHMRKLHAG